MQRKKTILLCLGIILCRIAPVPALAWDVRGSASVETSIYPNSALYLGQADQSISVKAEPEFYHQFENRDLISFIPFVRYDSVDDNRSHFDVRELSNTWVMDRFEVKTGVSKEFWGQIESLHLVDIINQSDSVEQIDGEKKLGQPMVKLTWKHPLGFVDFFVLPYFRERTFQDRGGRLRTPLIVDTDQTAFQSAAKNWHTDIAARAFFAVNKFEFAISHFAGTSRDPSARIGLRGDELVFTPFYEQINQTGIEMLYITGNWIWKYEGIQRRGQRSVGLMEGCPDYFAWAGGFEYTFTGIAGSGMDLGILTEWLHDDRGRKFSPFQNDLTLAARLGFNDIKSTEILIGLIQDIGGSAKFFSIEGSLRLTDHLRATLEVRALMKQPADDLLLYLRDDDFAKLELAYYF